MTTTAPTAASPAATLQRSLRGWATPLTIASFGLMAATGVLLFFHWNTPVQETIHAWLGWGLLAAVVPHGWMNWFGLKRHFQARGSTRWLVGLALLALVLSTAVRPTGPEGQSAPGIAIQALAKAPLAQVAPLFGQSPDEAVRLLAAAGLAVSDPATPIARIGAGDRETVGRALQVLAAAKPR